jgi:serine/threonine protein phosphatase PrpC
MDNSPYNVYTTSKLKTPQMQRNKSKNDLHNNNIPITDFEKKELNNNDLIDNKNNFFNSQKLPIRYNRNNFNNYDYKKNINNDYNNEYSKEKISDINLTEYSDENCSLIKSFSYKENPNRTYRDYMEDKSRVIQNINGDKNSHLFCLFDGHGGDNVSQFLQENFYKYFKEMCPITNPEEQFNELFRILDLKIKDLNLLSMGATACIIYITKENGKRVAYSANIGDTRSLLISSNDYKRLSYDHRATDSNEYNRIIKSGGIVFAGRVYGSLMLSRAFGDWELKSYGVISEPYVTKTHISDNDKYIIIATDGVWDTLDDSDVYEMSKNINNSKDLCNKIVEKSLDKGSMDNISCFVINLN